MDFRNLIPLLPILMGIALFLAGHEWARRADMREQRVPVRVRKEERR